MGELPDVPEDQDFIGMEAGAARDLAAERGVYLTPVRIDGESQIITMQLSSARLTVDIEGDVITSIHGRG